ncbi:MAG: hypothetical protein G01um101416_250 [Microgenomates group bacterium Gr01-1014_16]|nr:MAG: hypothetical protein G01um101416_250 [Microgenomates group bacterium Gr01-1014_16]
MAEIGRKGKVIIIVFGILVLFSMNRVIGRSLAFVGKCDGLFDRPNRVWSFYNCGGFTRYFIDELLGAGAVTFDNVILTMGNSLPETIYRHELAHTRQYSILGPAFLPLYGAAHLVAWVDSKIEGYQNPHAGNIFEIRADQDAGLAAEPKILK